MQKAIEPHAIQWNLEMPPTKVNGFLKEFPWVRNFVKGPITQTYVSRMDPSTLLIRASNDIRSSHDLIWLLDDYGHLVTAEVETKYYRRKYFVFGRMVSFKKVERITGVVPHETSIGEQLHRLQESARNVRYMLWYKHFDTYEGGQRLGAVILYKAPKATSINDWMISQIAIEASRYQAAVAAMDARTD